MIRKTLHFILLFSSFYTRISAQTYEIRAVNKGGGYVGVEMRNTSGASPTPTNFLTDLVFGLKWQKSYNVDLVNTLTSNYNIVKSDVRKLKGEYYYQAFSAANTPFSFPAAWQPNEWTEIMSIRNTLTGTGVGTFEIAEPGFDVTTEPNFGNNLTDYTPVVVASATNVPLPVNLTTFTASPANKAILVKWATTAEQNSKGFEVERSEGQTGSFQKMGWLDSKQGSGSNAYEFLDKEVVVRTKYYFRLKQIDHDSKYRYSEVRTAMLEEWDNKAIHILPNPASKVLQVFFDNTVERGPAVLQVVDTKGSVVLKRDHFVEVNGSVVLNVSAFANGQYFLVIERNKNILFSKPFQKQ